MGAIHLLARRTGLIGDIDRNLHLFKRHLPYHESDHVLNIAYNILAGGKHMEHLELRRNDEVYLNALGAVRIPDPTTAGDFCRRFAEHDIVTLMDVINRDAAASLGRATPRVLRGGDPRRRRHARRHRRRVQRRHRHRLRRDLGLSPSADLAGQHRRTALPGQSQRQPALARAGRRATSTRPSTCAAGPAFAGSCCAATPTSPRPSTSTAGMPTATQFVFGYRRQRQPSRPGPTTCPTRAYSFLERPPRYADQDRAPPAARTTQAADRPGARLQDDPPARGEGRRVRLSPSRLPPKSIAWSWSASVLGTDEGRCGCSRSTVTSSTSPTTERLRPRDRVPGQRPLRPGEPDRPTQERRACVDDAGGQSGEQLGVHGDGQPGLDAQGLVRPVLPESPRRGEARGSEAIGAADGVPDILNGGDPDAVPDRADVRTVGLPPAVLEPLAGGLPALVERLHGCGCAESSQPEVGVWMPRSPWAVEPREETGDGAERSAMLDGGRGLRVVEGT